MSDDDQTPDTSPPSSDSTPTPSKAGPAHGPLMTFLLNMKSLASVIMAVAALVVAIGNACKKPEEPGAKAAYIELSSAVKANSEAIAKSHDDVVALHNHVAGEAAPVGLDASTGDAARTPHAIPTVRRPPNTNVSVVVGNTNATSLPMDMDPAVAPVAHSVADIAPPSPRPPVFHPKGFENLPKGK